MTYRGHCEGGAQVCDATGQVLDFKDRDAGDSFAIADVTPVPRPSQPTADRFWLQPRGAVPAAVWAYQNMHGRRFYRRLSATAAAQQAGAMA